MKTPGSMENKEIDFSKELGWATKKWIRANGTPEQKAKLKASELTDEQRAKQREWEQMIFADEPTTGDDVDEKRLKNCLGRMFRTMNKRSSSAEIQPAELYRAAKLLLWKSYVEQVEFETGNPPVMAGRVDAVAALHQVAHWLVGQESTRKDGLCDCDKSPVQLIPIRKSLYLVGPLGTGKSSIAMAASYASIQLASAYNTGMRLGYTSLEEMIVSVYANQSLKPVEDACKGSMVLDELRSEHIGYKHFGNDVRILADILLLRHYAWKKGAQTIITSNIPPGDLDALINDERLSSRLEQQYETILVRGESLRKLPVGKR